jgi:hypothetical protein
LKRGRPFERGNHLGRGRPKGSRNKRSSLAKQLLDEHSEAIVHKCLVMALQGDGPLLRTLLPYILPRPKDLPCKFGPLPMTTIEELSQTFDATVTKVASGQITSNQAEGIFNWIEARRRIIETHELAERVSALEQTQKQDTE